MAWSVDGQNMRADAAAALITAVSMHTGDPGAAGTANEWSGGGYSRQAPSFDGAVAGVAGLSAPIALSGPAATDAAYVGLWNGSTFLGSVQRTSGDSAANANGEYSLTTLNITSPALITA